MKTLRSVLFWCHLALGLVAGIVILIMSVTGVLLTYEKQMLLWADARAVAGAYSPAATPTSVERLLASAATLSPSSVTLRADPAVPPAISVANPGGRGERSVYVDPASGAAIGEGSAGMRQFFRGVTDWHRWLAREGEGRTVGRAITGASNLGFLFIVLSGLYLWFPRTLGWTQFKNVLWFKRNNSSWARDFNWHHVIGLWCWLPLVVVVAAGVVISYPWAGNLVFRAAGEAPPVQGRPPGPPPAGAEARGPDGARGAGEAQRAEAQRPDGQRNAEGQRPEGQRAGDGGQRRVLTPDALAGLDTVIARARDYRADWKTISLRVPRDAHANVVVSIDAGMGGEPQKRDTVTFDRTGNIVKVEKFSDGTTGRRWRTILRFAHTGEVLGAIGQTIAGVASFGACVLAYTGAALSWRRWRTWMKRRAA